MIKLKLKHITLVDEVETKEALSILHEYKKKYRLIYIIPLGLLFLTLLISQNPTVSYVIVMGIITVLNIVIYHILLKPFYKLLRIAKNNDRVRHEEKIRHKERLCLNKKYPTNYTVDDIDNTLEKAQPKEDIH